eukprot:6827761-Pyramimonas_sp.AAC.1
MPIYVAIRNCGPFARASAARSFANRRPWVSVASLAGVAGQLSATSNAALGSESAWELVR